VLEEYEVLLGQYRQHPLIGEYLDKDVPAFEYLHQLLDMMTAEERIMVQVGFALYEDKHGATVRDLLSLSSLQFERVVEAIRLHRDR